MFEAKCADHLKALPLWVVVRTAQGVIRERTEFGWVSTGCDGSVVWVEADFPTKVVWSYAAELDDPTTAQLAQLAIVMLDAQLKKQRELEAAQAANQAAATNGEVPVPEVFMAAPVEPVPVAPTAPAPPVVVPPPAPVPISQVVIPQQAPQPQ